MKELKKFWNKLKYWQKGLIIGFFLPIIVFVIGLFLPIVLSMSRDSFNRLIFINKIIGLFVSPFCFFNIFASSGHPPICAIPLSYFSPLVYAIIGTLIGLIINKINKKWNQK